MDLEKIDIETAKDMLGKSINGSFDEIIKDDTVYQSNIDSIEKTYNNFEIEPLSKDTVQVEIPYSNIFQALIEDEAQTRFENAFYVNESKKNEDHELDDFNIFLEDLSNILFELDNIKCIDTFKEAGLLTHDDGFIVTLNDGHRYSITVVQER